MFVCHLIAGFRYDMKVNPYEQEEVMEFTAVIESAEEGGYIVFCPEVPGANGQGKTAEDAKQNLAEAVELLLLDRREDGLQYRIDHSVFSSACVPPPL